VVPGDLPRATGVRLQRSLGERQQARIDRLLMIQSFLVRM
jgi:hypothetical protein